jgi:hypothetical protein
VSPGAGKDGIDVVQENLRQLCIYQSTTGTPEEDEDDINRPSLFWSYVQQMSTECGLGAVRSSIKGDDRRRLIGTIHSIDADDWGFENPFEQEGGAGGGEAPAASSQVDLGMGLSKGCSKRIQVGVACESVTIRIRITIVIRRSSLVSTRMGFKSASIALVGQHSKMERIHFSTRK